MLKKVKLKTTVCNTSHGFIILSLLKFFNWQVLEEGMGARFGRALRRFGGYINRFRRRMN
jgi:hypothetical protein